MKARFIKDMPNARIVRNKTNTGQGKVVEYVVERCIYLGKQFFIPFREHLIDEDPNITKYKDDMFVDENGVWHALMFCCVSSDIMLLVNSKGTNFAKMLPLLPMVEKKLKRNLRQTIAINS